MALKDWKKLEYSKKHIMWSVPYSWKRIHYYGFRNKYRLDITMKNGGEDFRVFKSKFAALKFAKSYMRKH